MAALLLSKIKYYNKIVNNLNTIIINSSSCIDFITQFVFMQYIDSYKLKYVNLKNENRKEFKLYTKFPLRTLLCTHFINNGSPFLSAVKQPSSYWKFHRIISSSFYCIVWIKIKMNMFNINKVKLNIFILIY